MIDLTNKPEGATRFNNTCAYGWLKKNSKGIAYFMPKTGWQYYTSKEVGMDAWDASILVSVDEWSIYSNTLPLSELLDEQRGLLFNHWCNGGEIEYQSYNEWIAKAPTNNIMNKESIYRAKKKTERELFIEAAKTSASLRARDGADTVYGELFDAGFKAPKVGE